ncbi:MAG TPA: DnaB-like helicase C-terminal domain-containing protein [Armatimonadota bacterium]|nr:DnaB-like helicase C-terminal domain-containing protein [Armatimonadota bacterium]
MSFDRYRNLWRQLKSFLQDYLQTMGHEPNEKGQFRCINPEHEDKKPSCGFVDAEKTMFHCFSCLVSGDIFTAAHFLEGRPTQGQEFVTENVFALADQFNIPYEGIEIAPKTLKSQDIARAYELATSLLRDSDDGSVAEAIYGWSLDAMREVEPNIGTVEWDTFSKKLREYGGYTLTWLESNGITAQLFDKHLLTFAIKNANGVVRGFAARDSREGSRIQKWRNTSSDVQVFEKSKLLYGIDIARSEPGPLYLVEGYTDVIAGRLAGIKNFVAYMGSAPHRNQIESLKQARKFDLILVPDADENGAGFDGVQRALDKIFPDFPDMNVRIKQLPFTEDGKSQDVSDYLNTHSLADFLNISNVNSFEWRLDRLDLTIGEAEICKKVMPIIIEEKSPLEQELMLKMLAAKTDIRLAGLQRELDEQLREKRGENRKRAQIEINTLRSAMESDDFDPTVAGDVLRGTAMRLDDIARSKFTANRHGSQETENFVQTLKQSFEERGTAIPGWTTGFKSIDESLGGIPQQECMISLAGDGNVGKSAIVQNIALGVARNNPEVSVLLFTIDDTRSQTIPRLISQMTALPINIVTQPQRYTRELAGQPGQDLKKAWAEIQTLVQQRRLDIKDASQGNTIAYADQWVEHVQTLNPGRRILFILDNFHRLRGFTADGDREKLEQASDAVFMMTKQRGITAMCTMELRKRESMWRKPSIQDLKGTKRFEYDNSVILMIHSQLHAAPENEDVDCWSEDGVRKPILHIHFDKNKVTSFKGRVRMKFRPETSQLLEIEDTGSGGFVPGAVPD